MKLFSERDGLEKVFKNSTQYFSGRPEKNRYFSWEILNKKASFETGISEIGKKIYGHQELFLIAVLSILFCFW